MEGGLPSRRLFESPAGKRYWRAAVCRAKREELARCVVRHGGPPVRVLPFACYGASCLPSGGAQSRGRRAMRHRGDLLIRGAAAAGVVGPLWLGGTIAALSVVQ